MKHSLMVTIAMLTVIEKCKYLLPCGHCDKFDRLCNYNTPIELNHEYIEGSQKVRIFDNKTDCDHQWSWQRSTSKGDLLYICKCCGAIKKKYPMEE